MICCFTCAEGLVNIFENIRSRMGEGLKATHWESELRYRYEMEQFLTRTLNGELQPGNDIIQQVREFFMKVVGYQDVLL